MVIDFRVTRDISITILDVCVPYQYLIMAIAKAPDCCIEQPKIYTVSSE